MLTLFITTNLLALTHGDTFWDATNGECALFTPTTPAIFIRDSGRCGVCPASTCNGNTGNMNFSPRCFSLTEPRINDYEANQAFYAKCFDPANNPGCDASGQYFEWEVFPKNCSVDHLGIVDNNACPSCVDSNTPCALTTEPLFVVDAPPSGDGGMCYISGCTTNLVREFKVFNGINLQYLDAMTYYYIRDRCPALSNCNDTAQWMMDFCECPYCIPTKFPTKTPSQTPSKFPSKTPSQTPSQTPTKFPTQTPSQSPSKFPIKYPTTQQPSQTPSQTPTQFPTQTPSQTPSKYPTPTQTPSQYPSKFPSKTPSKFPSKTPSQIPSQIPSHVTFLTNDGNAIVIGLWIYFAIVNVVFVQ